MSGDESVVVRPRTAFHLYHVTFSEAGGRTETA
jgi:hypothetical protein